MSLQVILVSSCRRHASGVRLIPDSIGVNVKLCGFFCLRINPVMNPAFQLSPFKVQHLVIL